MKKKKLFYLILPFAIIVIAFAVYNIIVYATYLSIINDTSTSIIKKETDSNLDISIKKGDNYARIKRGIISFIVTPQFAIWLEDSDGIFVETIYVTPKVDKIDRKAALPVWRHKDLNVDTVSGSTPKNNSNFQSNTKNQLTDGYKILLEINISYDNNDYYPLGSDFSGQPSLVYAATFNSKDTEYKLSLIGHGSIDGTDGKIYSDLDNITGANDIINSVIAKITK